MSFIQGDASERDLRTFKDKPSTQCLALKPPTAAPMLQETLECFLLLSPNTNTSDKQLRAEGTVRHVSSV